MLIDWFTVAAQAVNFLILAGLLKVFLYGRITRAMDEREAGLKQQREEAEQNLMLARQEKEEYQARRAAIEDERNRVLSEAREDVEETRQKLLEEVRDEIQQSREDWAAALARDRSAFCEQLRLRASDETLSLTRQLLADLADERLQDRMTQVLLRRLNQANREQKAEMAAALKRSGNSALLRSSFALSKGQMEEISGTLVRLAGLEGETVALEEHSDPGLICGLEVEVGGSKIGWSADDFLGQLEEHLVEALDEEIRRNQSETRRR